MITENITWHFNEQENKLINLFKKIDIKKMVYF